MKKINLVEIDSEVGAGTRGASLGIGAVKIASINAGSTYFAEYPVHKVATENHVLFEKSKASTAKNIKTIAKVFKNLGKTMKKVLAKGNFPIVLAGDHSTAAGTIAGIKSAFPDKRIGAIWIDAHADLHSPYTSPTGNVHGMPLAMALAEDNKESKTGRKVSRTEKKYWEKLKNISGQSPTLLPTDLVFMGVRDTEEQEDYLMEKHNIKNFTVTEVRTKGIKKVIEETNQILKDCDLIYITFDVDSMDCTYVSHGTGTPVPVGFTEWEATKLMTSLLENEKVCCFEVTEVNPTLDEKCNVMAETAFRILEKSTAVVQNRL